MKDVVVGAVAGLIMGSLAGGFGWRQATSRSESRAPADEAPLKPAEAIAGSAPLVTDLHRAVRLLARHAGEGWIRCPVGGTLPPGPIREWSHAVVEDGELVATVAEPEGSAALHSTVAPADADPAVVVRWTNAFAGEAGRCRVMAPEWVEVTGLVVDRSARPVPHGVVQGEFGHWPVDDDGFFVARCLRGAPCRLTPEPSARRPGRPVRVIVEQDGGVIELPFRPTRRTSWLRQVKRESAHLDRVVHMVDPIELALRDPQMPPPIVPLFMHWQERDEAERRSTAGLLDALAVR